MIAFVRGVMAASICADVDGEVALVDVHEDRPRAGVEDAVRAGDEGERDGDHLVAGPDPVAEQGEVQRRRAGAGGHRVRDADEGGEVLLELAHPRALGQRAGGHRLPDPLLLLLAHLRARDRDHVVAASCGVRCAVAGARLLPFERRHDPLGGVPVAVQRRPRAVAVHERRVGQRRSPAASGSAPTTRFQPASTVSTHSVSERSVTHGTPARYASFCTPPESVAIACGARLEGDHLEVADRIDGDARSAAAQPAALEARPRCAGGRGR